MYEFLRTVDLFAELSDSDLRRLSKDISELHLASGEDLFVEGDPGDRAYIIREGKLEILTASGGRAVLIAVGAGTALVLLKWPFRETGLALRSGSSGVEGLVREYFDIRI